MQLTNNLHSRIQAHPGKRILDALKAYRFTLDIFAGNANELRLLAVALEDINDPLKIDDINQRERLQSLFSEVTRLFHNFLAGGNTLIDHTRNLIKEDFIAEEHRAEHISRIKLTFEDNPLARFIKDFRNYVLHRAIPHISLKETFEPKRKTLNLDLTPMLTWQGWSSPARSFIAVHDPMVRMLDLVDQYEAMIKASHEALISSFQTHYEKPINEVLALIRQWNSGIQI